MMNIKSFISKYLVNICWLITYFWNMENIHNYTCYWPYGALQPTFLSYFNVFSSSHNVIDLKDLKFCWMTSEIFFFFFLGKTLGKLFWTKISSSLGLALNFCFSPPELTWCHLWRFWLSMNWHATELTLVTKVSYLTVQ